MSSQTAMSLLGAAEFALSSLVAYLFWKKKLHSRFPAMGAYLALRVASTPILLALFYVQSQPWGQSYFAVYFFTFYPVYIASTALLFFVCMEVFRSALSALPGLMKIGLVIFRWAIVVSVLVTISSMSFQNRGIMILPDFAFALMRSVSILELCLLAFLCLAMNALRLSVRDMAFGIALGFGMMAANDFIAASLTSHSSSLTAPVQFVYESVILFVLGLWAAYSALPERVRQPVLMPADSRIVRWNEIASALGHTGTQVALQPTTNSFFLTDVEKVVEKVLNRTLKSSESKS